MTTPFQSPVVPITAQNPPDRMPGAVEEKAKIVLYGAIPHLVEALIRCADGDFDDVLAKLDAQDKAAATPTASGDPCAKASAVRQHQIGSDAPKEPTRFHDGDLCARAAVEIGIILDVWRKDPDRNYCLNYDIAAIIRREVAGHYEKEISELRAALYFCPPTSENDYEGMTWCDAYGELEKELADLRTRLATAERERDESRNKLAVQENLSVVRDETHEGIERDLRARLSAAEADSKRLADYVLALAWLEENLLRGRGTIELGITENGNVGVWVNGPDKSDKAAGSGIDIIDAIDSARQQHNEE